MERIEMKLTQTEIEEAHDKILMYLEGKSSMSIENILNGINKFHKDRFKIISELKSKNLIREHISEHQEYSGYGFEVDRKPSTRREYEYSISPEGREFVRKGGFKKERTTKFWRLAKENVWGWATFISTAIAILLFVQNQRLKGKVEDRTSQASNIGSSQFQSTEEVNTVQLENDTTP